MPQLGESVVEGTVGRWMVQEGQPVKEYEPLLAVTTDKVDTEVPAPASGILLRIHVPEGQTVAAGTLLAEIGAVDELSAASQAESAAGPSAAHGNGAAHPQPAPSPAANAPRAASTPLAQRLAAEHGIDVADVPGTGPGGRVTKEDVEAFLAATGAEDVDASQGAAPRGVGFISPAVGRLAAEMGVDLSQVVGTGAGGRITKKDVLAYVAAPSPRGEPARATT
jgi:pyruvate/2-oxoglutarate dehydrogenase complex dihydrolipoamide acyltransferase (E2) component